MLARPRFDLATVAIRAAIAVRSVAIPLLQKLLVLALEFAFQNDAANVGATFAKPFRAVSTPLRQPDSAFTVATPSS
jgi:hypothetical protein